MSFTLCDSGESEQAQRDREGGGEFKAEQGLCIGRRREEGGYAMSQPWLKKETEQLPQGTSKVKKDKR